MRAIVNEIDGATVQTIEDGDFAAVRANVTAEVQAMLDEVATGGIVQRTLLVGDEEHVVKVVVKADAERLEKVIVAQATQAAARK